MKKIVKLMMLAVIPLCFAACNSGEDAEKVSAMKRADSLQAIIDNKDSEIDALFDVLNEIETSLGEISSRYSKVNKLKQSSPEMNQKVKGQITDQLAEIENILSQNKQKIASLTSKIASLGAENTKLQEFVESLNNRIAEQESQISSLSNELNISKETIKKMATDIEDLTESNKEKEDYIAYQTAEANKAYYIVGTYKELQEFGIVDKSGGFIGIGKKQSTNANMDISKFRTIDRTQVTTITVGLRKAQLISQHPEGSYELVMDENDPKKVASLVIKDVNAFWRNTQYLVISTKK